ncbi:MAG: hypothetical protein ACK4WC_00215 [Rubrimonas sp.]
MRSQGGFPDDDASPPSIWDEDAGFVAYGHGHGVNPEPEPDDDPDAAADASAWRRAETSAWRALVEAASRFARVDERLRAMPATERRAAVGRLAITAATELLRREGDLIGPERLARAMLDREGMGGEDAPSIGRAVWAALRLGEAALQNRSPAAGVEDPATEIDGRGSADGPTQALVARWRAAMTAAADLHPFTRAAYGRARWSTLGLSAAGMIVERDVTAMRAAAAAGMGGIGFAPLGRNGPRPDLFRASADAAGRRLLAWLASLDEGAASALGTLDALAAWRVRAEAAVCDLSGRTPPRLIAALVENPAVDAPSAARAAGCSTSAAARNFAILEARGVAREITGQGRFRVWTAALPPGR